MITLFIGRFQPFHKGHLQDILSALKFSEKIIIAIGSSEEKDTRDNPFSFEERKEMISHVLKKNNIQNCEIIAIPDINDDARWAEHVKSLTGDFDAVYTGNKLVKKLFSRAGYPVKDVALLPNVNATEIRRRIDYGEDWQELVPKEVADYVHKISGVNRIKEINGKL